MIVMEVREKETIRAIRFNSVLSMSLSYTRPTARDGSLIFSDLIKKIPARVTQRRGYKPLVALNPSRDFDVGSRVASLKSAERTVASSSGWMLPPI
jgi:hypothetical protein